MPKSDHAKPLRGPKAPLEALLAIMVTGRLPLLIIMEHGLGALAYDDTRLHYSVDYKRNGFALRCVADQ